MIKSTKFNICIVQPKDYIHSLAFLELSELLHYALLELGHQSSIHINRVENDATNIIIGCHLLDPKIIDDIPKTSIIINTEQIYKDKMEWNKNIYAWTQKFTTWDYSQKNVSALHELGISNCKILKIGFQKELSRLNMASQPDIDVLFYGSINPRRQKVLDELKALGLKTEILFGVYGKERDSYIERSKIVINLHHYESEIFEIVRVFYLLTNSVAVLGEVNPTTTIDDYILKCIFPSTYENLTGSCLELLQKPNDLNDLRKNAFELFSKCPQSSFLEEIL